MRRVLQGIAASPGVVWGPVVFWEERGGWACGQTLERTSGQASRRTSGWTSERAPEQAFGGPSPSPGALDFEAARRLWNKAKASSMEFLKGLEDRTMRDAGPEAAEIFGAHRMILDDPMLDEMVLERLSRGMAPAEAISGAVEALAEQLEALDNEYMRERAADVRDIGRRLLDFFPGSWSLRIPALKGPSVLVARDLAPSQAAALDKRLLLGIVLKAGSRTSHTAILARALGIPAVVSVRGLFEGGGSGGPGERGESGECGELGGRGESGGPCRAGDRARGPGGTPAGWHPGETIGEMILVDGEAGTVIIDPSPDDLEGYAGKLRPSVELASLTSDSAPGAGPAEAVTASSAAAVPGGAAMAPDGVVPAFDGIGMAPGSVAVTADGVRVRLAANVGSLDELAVLRRYGLSEIGLCRTEFLFLEFGRVPTEDEQFVVYRQIAEAVRPGLVVFRTLDAGGDKDIPGLALHREANPFLGLRGLRFCLANRELFKTQIRALLRASAFGNVRVMFPMVATLEEYREAMGVVRGAREELAGAGVQFDHDVKWGIMVETPAAAITADQFAREVDFLSIGTNDLIQYTIAVDRLNERVNYLYQPFHPAVLRLIHQVIQAAHRHGREVGMCGEMAGMPEAAPLLLGMGLDEFSVSPPAAPAVRKALERVTCEEARRLASQATGG